MNQVQNFNDDEPLNSPGGAQYHKKYDLEDRTMKFAEDVIGLSQILPENHIIYPLKNQFIRSGTSVGANYSEADSAESRKDFFHKIAICRKEAKETLYWLKLIIKADPIQKEKYYTLLKEAQELTLIFSAIFRKSKPK